MLSSRIVFKIECRLAVGARNPVVPGHAAFLYSWMSPSHRLDRRTTGLLPGDLIGMGTLGLGER